MLFNTPKNSHKHEWSLIAGLRVIYQDVVTYLAKIFYNDSEIRVWTSLDSEKNLQWHVYNYRTNRTGTFNTEVEAIEWIEESYKQLPNANKKFWYIPGSSILRVL